MPPKSTINFNENSYVMKDPFTSFAVEPMKPVVPVSKSTISYTSRNTFISFDAPLDNPVMNSPSPMTQSVTQKLKPSAPRQRICGANRTPRLPTQRWSGYCAGRKTTKIPARTVEVDWEGNDKSSKFATTEPIGAVQTSTSIPKAPVESFANTQTSVQPPGPIPTGLGALEVNINRAPTPTAVPAIPTRKAMKAYELADQKMADKINLIVGIVEEDEFTLIAKPIINRAVRNGVTKNDLLLLMKEMIELHNSQLLEAIEDAANKIGQLRRDKDQDLGSSIVMVDNGQVTPTTGGEALAYSPEDEGYPNPPERQKQLVLIQLVTSKPDRHNIVEAEEVEGGTTGSRIAEKEKESSELGSEMKMLEDRGGEGKVGLEDPVVSDSSKDLIPELDAGISSQLGRMEERKKKDGGKGMIGRIYSEGFLKDIAEAGRRHAKARITIAERYPVTPPRLNAVSAPPTNAKSRDACRIWRPVDRNKVFTDREEQCANEPPMHDVEALMGERGDLITHTDAVNSELQSTFCWPESTSGVYADGGNHTVEMSVSEGIADDSLDLESVWTASEKKAIKFNWPVSQTAKEKIRRKSSTTYEADGVGKPEAPLKSIGRPGKATEFVAEADATTIVDASAFTPSIWRNQYLLLLTLIIIGSILFSASLVSGLVFTNNFLPLISPSDRIGDLNVWARFIGVMVDVMMIYIVSSSWLRIKAIEGGTRGGKAQNRREDNSGSSQPPDGVEVHNFDLCSSCGRNKALKVVEEVVADGAVVGKLEVPHGLGVEWSTEGT